MTEVIAEITAKGYDVDLRHDDKETTQQSHGWVTISTAEGVELAKSDDLQHNRTFNSRKANAAQMVNAAVEQLAASASK